MSRWIMLVSMIAGLALVFTTKSSGVLAIGLLLVLVGTVGLVGLLAAARVSASARPEVTMASPEDLQALGTLRAPAPDAASSRLSQPVSTTAPPCTSNPSES